MASNNGRGHPQGPYSQGQGYYNYANQQQQQQQQYGGAWQQPGGWQPRPVSLQAQHYYSAPPPQYQQYGAPMQYQPYAGHVHPPPPPSGGAYVNHHHPGYGVGPRPYHHHQPYLTSRPIGQKRKRKKDIVPPLEPMVENARVREPLNEAERKEIEAWKAERRKHWPTEENVRRKKEEEDDRSIKLTDVLDTQKRLGLIKKAGTKELIDSLSKRRPASSAKRARKGEGSVRRVGAGQARPVHRPTLLERLLEKDIRSYKAKVVQIFQFAYMNGYFENNRESELVFPSCKEDEAGERALLLEDVPSPSLASSSCTGSDNDDDDDEDS